MIAFRRLFFWIFVLAVCGLGWGAWNAYQLWVASDEILRSAVVDKLQTAAPDGWQVRLEAAGYDFRGRVRLTQLELFTPDDPLPAIMVPDLSITLDKDQLRQSGSIVVREVRAWRPKFRVRRNQAGEWNVAGHWTLPEHGAKTLPSWQLEQAEILLEAAPLAPATLSEAQIVILSEGRDRVRVSVAGAISHGGHLTLNGHGSVSGADFEISGKWTDSTVDDHLLTQARLAGTLATSHTASADSIRTQFPALDRLLRQFADKFDGGQERPAVTLVSASQEPSAWVPRLDVDWDFFVSQRPGNELLDGRVLAVVKGGSVAHGNNKLLTSVRGQVYGDRNIFQVRQLSADSSAGTLQFDADFNRSSTSKIALTAANVTIDQQLKSKLPESLRKVVDELSLQGVVDAAVDLHSPDVNAPWQYTAKLTSQDCRFAYDRFPYPIENVTGTLTVKDGMLEADLEGIGGGRVVSITGYARNVGPEAEAAFDVKAQNVPLDRRFLEAAPLEIRRIIDQLALQGNFDLHIRLLRPPGPGRKFEPQLAARTTDGSVEFEGFPYRLTDLSGTVVFVNDVWRFNDLRARHGQATFAGSGIYHRDAIPALKLTIQAADVAIAENLRLALPASQRAVWDELNPTGILHGTCQVNWSPGTDLDVRLSDAHMEQGSLTIRQFPYFLSDFAAELSYENNQATIRSASARHDETTVRCETCTVSLSDDRSWRAVLEKLYVDDLQPDAGFRRTLPEALRERLETVDPKGLISSAGSMELRHSGDPREPVHVGWNQRTWLTGISLTTGVVLKNVRGRLDSQGIWTGGEPDVAGKLDIDSVDVFGYHVTDIAGDFRTKDGWLVVGKGDTVAPASYEDAIKDWRGMPRESVVGKAIDGAVTLDLFADLTKTEVDYSARLSLSRGDLEAYARRYLGGRTNLRGKMNGWVTLRGHGDRQDRITGRGQLQISPAALYELPVVVQIFSVLKFEPPERTAFNYAFVDFDMAASQYNFRTIDLVGSSISLRGRGHMQFDGVLSLDFYSTAGRGRGGIPLWSDLVGQATRWYGVQVRGTAESPEAEIKMPQFDDALKKFLAPFDPGGRSPIPRFPFIGPPLTRRPADAAPPAATSTPSDQ